MRELFLTVFNTAVTAGWLVLAVLLARLLLKKAPAWAKCALWAVVALRLVWPFELESILSLVPSAQTLPPAVLTDPAPQIHTGIYVMNSVINPSFTQTFAPAPGASVHPLQIVVMAASVLWIAGMVAMAGYGAASYLRLRRRVRVSMPAGEGVYLCDHISSPFILGLIRPRIYLPSGLPQEKWETILAHERAHLARRDHWWKPLGFALLAVFWFHPLLWIAYILLCRDVELACDEKVVKTLSDEEKRDYSETLLQCSVPKKWISACPLAFGETGVKTRIKAVLHYKKPTLWIIIAALIVCSVLAVCFLTDPVHDQAIMLFDRDHPDTALQGDVALDGFWDVSVRWNIGSNLTGSEAKPTLVQDGAEITLFEDYPVLRSLYAADVTGDGKPDLCADIYYPFSGLPSFNAVCVYDIVAERYYLLSNGTDMSLNQWVSYYLRIEDGKLVCDKFSARSNGFLETGTLFLADTGENMILCFEPRNEPVTEADVAGKQYVYTKTGAGSPFYINIYADGTFQYYAGFFSSHIGLGDWELKDGKLYLYDTTLQNPMTFVFSVTENTLAYIADESHPFMYVDVADGDLFKFCGEIKSPEQDQISKDTENAQPVGDYSENSGDFSWNFVLSVSQNGTYFYSEGLASSYIGVGSWEMKDGKLYLTEGERCFVFQVRADGLVFIAGESDRGLSLEDGQLLSNSQIDTRLTFVEVTDIQKDHFLALDALGNPWRIEYACSARGFDLKKCWVTYFGPPAVDDEGRYLVRAASCWLYREGNGDAGTIFDSYTFDVDGDGTAEHCYLTSVLTSSPAYVSRLNTMVYQLIVTKADGTTYRAAFLKLLIPDENTFGTIISPDLDTTQHRRVYAYEDAFAFVVENGKLLIAAPMGAQYIETGAFTTYQITLTEDELIVIPQ